MCARGCTGGGLSTVCGDLTMFRVLLYSLEAAWVKVPRPAGKLHVPRQ
jgi:hypothetical protein